jgi:hypothetical protein
MQFIRHAIALLAVVASTHTMVASQDSHVVNTTGDFVALCDVSTDAPLYAASMAFCLGYIDAVMDYHAALTAGPTMAPRRTPRTAGRHDGRAVPHALSRFLRTATGSLQTRRHL